MPRGGHDPQDGPVPALEAHQAGLETLERRLALLTARERSLEAKEAELERGFHGMSLLTSFEAAVTVPLSPPAVPGPAPRPAPAVEELTLDTCSDPSTVCGMVLQGAAALWLVAVIGWVAWFLMLDGSIGDKGAVLGLTTPKNLKNPWTLASLVMMIVGLSVCVVAFSVQDMAATASAALLLNLSAFCFFIFGDDPLLTKAVEQQVLALSSENGKLKQMREELSSKAKDLHGVTNDIDQLQHQLVDQETADLEDILDTLHTDFALQTVSTVVQHFFNTDLDNSGHVSGFEATGFVQGLNLLWELVPDQELKSRFQRHLVEHGLNYYELTLIMDPMIQGDSTACQAQLEDLMKDKPQPGAVPSAKSRWASPSRGGAGPAVLEEDYAEQAMAPETMSSLSSLGSGAGLGGAALKKGPASPTRCFLRWILSLTALLAACLLVVALIAVNETGALLGPLTFVMNVLGAVCAGAALLLAIALNIGVDLLENLMRLRKEVRQLAQTNEKMNVEVKNIEEEVSKLQRLKIGLEQFRKRFDRDLAAAREELAKHHTVVKMQVASTIVAVFKDMTSRVGKKQIDPGKEVREFWQRINDTFKDKGGYPMKQMQTEIMKYESTGIDANALYKMLGLRDAEVTR